MRVRTVQKDKDEERLKASVRIRRHRFPESVPHKRNGIKAEAASLQISINELRHRTGKYRRKKFKKV